jgi:CBS domain-containing protein
MKAFEAMQIMKRHPAVSFLPVVDSQSSTLSGLITLDQIVSIGL